MIALGIAVTAWGLVVMELWPRQGHESTKEFANFDLIKKNGTPSLRFGWLTTSLKVSPRARTRLWTG